MNTAGSEQVHHGRVPKSKLDGHYEQLVEHSFDSSIKRMSVAYRYYPAEGAEKGDEPHTLVVMKGAYEKVFERCTKILMGDGEREITEEDRKNTQAYYDKLASQGLRVLTLCGRKESPEKAEEYRTMDRDELEQNMCFYGLAGI
jgi:Na+-exporting ATPase